jgi:transcriptional regulator with XRE-family HTH domain
MPRRPLDPKEVLVRVGRRIAELRVERGLTQQQLADVAGTGWKYQQQVELGYENLTLKSLVRFANLLNVTLAELMQSPKTDRPERPGRPSSKVKPRRTPPRN